MVVMITTLNNCTIFAVQMIQVITLKSKSNYGTEY